MICPKCGKNMIIGNEVTRDRTKAWACEECKFVLIDCN